MSIALATVVFVLIFLPGYSFRLFYLRPPFPHSRRNVDLEEAIPANPLKAIASAVVLSFPIHIFFLALTHLFTATSLHYHYLAALLTGEYGPNGELLMPITDNIEANLPTIFAYFLLVNLVSAVAGFLFGVVRWNFLEPTLNRNDIRTIPNEWFYRFPIGRNILIQIDALSKIGSGDRTNILYRGFLNEYTVDADGDLQDLFLTSAFRGVFNRRFEFKEIPGDLFVINYQQIKNLNITYYEIEETA